MADPVLDEDYIMQLLRSPVTHETADLIQGGAAQALVDLYDRKVTRDEFVAACSRCLSLYGKASRFNMLQDVRVVFDAGNLDKNSFDVADKGLRDAIRTQSEGLVDLVKRLMQCPTSRDPIN